MGLNEVLSYYNISLLYVEDDANTREELTYTLNHCVRELHIASNGQKGLELYLEKKPDLILTDIQMPIMDGLSMAKQIKETDSTADIIFLTAFNDATYLLEAIKIGIDGYVSKPVNLMELFNVIKKVASKILLQKERDELTLLLDGYKKTVDLSLIVSKTDVDGFITYVNDQFCEISGYRKDELLGQKHNLIRHPDMPNELFKDLWKTIKKEKKPWFGKIKNRTKDGNCYWVKSVINPILDSNGEIQEFIAVRTDVTSLEERKEYLKTQYSITSEKYDDIVQLSKLYEESMDKSSIISRINTDLVITYVNDNFCDYTEYTREELVNKSYEVLLHDDLSVEYIKDIAKHAFKYGHWKGKLKSYTKTGKEIFYNTTIMPIHDKDGNPIEFMAIRQDLTENVKLYQEMEKTQKEILYKLGSVGETRSQETGFHVTRVALYCHLLAIKAGLSEHEAKLLRAASPMHDIGKIGIPDSILNKPGRLSDEEFEIMKTHATIGYNIFQDSEREILKAAAIVAHEHHEKWDGSGYPRGLAKTEIHIFGRICAICDVFDALAHDRVYKKAWEMNKIIEFFKEQRVKHFDPTLIDIFLNHLNEFLEIKEKYDEEPN